jgi:hypothetical protein
MPKIKREMEMLIEATLVDPSINNRRLDQVLDLITKAARQAHKAESMQPDGWADPDLTPPPKETARAEVSKMMDRLYQYLQNGDVEALPE